MARTGDGPESKPMKKGNLSGKSCTQKEDFMKKFAIVVCLLAMVLSTAVVPSPAYAQQTTSDADAPDVSQGDPVTIDRPVVKIFQGTAQAAQANASCEIVSSTPVVGTVSAAGNLTTTVDMPYSGWLPIVVTSNNCPVIADGASFLSGALPIGPRALGGSSAPGLLQYDLPTADLSYNLNPSVPYTDVVELSKLALPEGAANYEVRGVWKVTSFGSMNRPENLTFAAIENTDQTVPLPPSNFGNWEGQLLSALNELRSNTFGVIIKPNTKLAPAPDKLQLRTFGSLCPEQAQRDALYLGSFPVVKGLIQEWWSYIFWGLGENGPCTAAKSYIYMEGATTLSLLPQDVGIQVTNLARQRARVFNSEIDVQLSDGRTVRGTAAIEPIDIGGWIFIAVVVTVIVGGVLLQQYYVLGLALA